VHALRIPGGGIFLKEQKQFHKDLGRVRARVIRRFDRILVVTVLHDFRLRIHVISETVRVHLRLNRNRRSNARKLATLRRVKMICIRRMQEEWGRCKPKACALNAGPMKVLEFSPLPWVFPSEPDQTQRQL
jgi:hypothetical protein